MGAKNLPKELQDIVDGKSPLETKNVDYGTGEKKQELKDILEIQKNNVKHTGVKDIVLKDDGVNYAKPGESLIDPSKTTKINYKSKKFLNGCKKVQERIEETIANKQPDYEKKRKSFTI